MDEREAESLFSGVPGEVPEPTFSVEDVIRRSKRETVRRRNRITAGAGAVLVAAGLGTWGIVGVTGEKSASVGSSAAAPAQPGGPAARPLSTGDYFPAQPSRQGDSGDGRTGPRAEGTSGCARVDWELAIALAGELPGHLTAAQASPSSVCTTDSRGAGFPLPDGKIAAALFARGAVVSVPAQPSGAVVVQQATASGGTLVLVSVPGTTGRPAPYAADLARFAAALAPRF
ncbi:hypothetical protein [Amycolatopsis benzoatilytica]|uniref:hypothetical protein n=1 Tax=Amycolatopsis benzoatilytica TaxID=346045 RepID=UPI0003A7D01D|nr:hypothetical protein [Amycolatopsis benzoatilytica]